MHFFQYYFTLFIDSLFRFSFKRNSSVMDGLNKFFKIPNNYRRQSVMFRTICITFLNKHFCIISKA